MHADPKYLVNDFKKKKDISCLAVSESGYLTYKYDPIRARQTDYLLTVADKFKGLSNSLKL